MSGVTKTMPANMEEFGFSAKVGLDEGLRLLVRERSLTVR